MKTHTLKKGTIVKIDGIPVRLLGEVKAETATSLKKAAK